VTIAVTSVTAPEFRDETEGGYPGPWTAPTGTTSHPRIPASAVPRR
jgi:hypothetical protein